MAVGVVAMCLCAGAIILEIRKSTKDITNTTEYATADILNTLQELRVLLLERLT